jgi:hypothetical protein
MWKKQPEDTFVKRLLDECIVSERASSLIILVLFLVFVGVIMAMSVPMA